MLALAHLAPVLLRLTVGHPEGTGETLGHRLAPQHQHVDALVRLAVAAQRSCNAAGGMLGVPWLEPRAHAVFELGNNAIGHAAIDIGAGTGHRSVLPSRSVNSEGSR